jgi:hypothetical protein
VTSLAGAFAWTAGLGSGLDFTAGARGEQAFAEIRWQVAGRDDDPFLAGRPRLDASLDLGATSSAAETAFAFAAPYVPWAELFLGANASLRLARGSPYVTYRRHWGTLSYGPPGAEGGRPLRERLVREELYVGAEIALSEETNSRLALEVYYGRTPSDVPSGTEVTYEMWGLNVVHRTGF